LDKRYTTINLKLDERCANSSPVPSTSIPNTSEIISDSSTSTGTNNTNIIVQPGSNPSKSKQVHRISSFYVPKKVSEGQAKKIDNQLLKFFITINHFQLLKTRDL
jgi:hypothetical protein